MPFANNNGVKIYWQEKGEGTPLVLVMGHRFTSEMWYPVLPAVTPKHRVIWFDNRGVGQSDTAPTASVAEMVADAFAVMDAAGVRSAHVWGVSMGGGIAQQMAITSPERVTSLVLGCTAIKTEVIPPPTSLQKLAVRLPVAMYKLAGRKALWGPAASKEACAKDFAMLKAEKITVAGVIAQSVGIASFAMTLEDAAGISVPTLVQHGTADKAVPFAAGQQIAATIPGAKLSVFEGAGHNYLVCDAERANREVLDFIAAVDATATASR
jgi:pimeloyl-ACP methyl ester carboxylesterase